MAEEVHLIASLLGWHPVRDKTKIPFPSLHFFNMERDSFRGVVAFRQRRGVAGTSFPGSYFLVAEFKTTHLLSTAVHAYTFNSSAASAAGESSILGVHNIC